MIKEISQYIIAILFISFFPLSGVSQFSKPINFNVEDGLPSPEVYDLQFDEDGKLWITTDRGVSIYDGYSFKNFNINDGLGDNTNFEIIKDKNDRLWFTGYNGSLSYFENGQFKSLDSGYNYRIKNNKSWIDDIRVLDSTKYIIKNKELHSAPSEVYILDTKKKEIHPINLNDFIPEEENSKSEIISIDSLKLIYDKRYKAIYLQKKDKASIYASNPFQINKKTRIYTNKNVIKTIDNGAESLEAEIIDEILYVCTFDGIEMYDISNNYKFQGKLLEGNLITFITKGPSDNLWISSQNNGIFKISKTVIKEYDFPQKLAPAELVTTPTHLFIGCRNGNGIYSYNKKYENQFQLKGDMVFYPYLLIYDDTLMTSNFKKIVIRNDIPTLLNPNVNYQRKTSVRLQNIIKLKNGRFLTGNQSLVITDSNKKVLKKVSGYSKIRNLLQDKNQDIYFSTPSNLYKIIDYDYANIINLSEIEKLLNVRITEIKQVENQGIIYSTLGNGLIYQHDNYKELQQISEQEGLSSNLVNDVFIEGDSIIWAGTNNGLSKISYKIEGEKLVIKNTISLKMEDGLSSNYIYDIDYWNDNLWVVTESGINFFKYKELKPHKISPSILIESVRINGRDTVLANSNKLKYFENDIEFNYTGINYNKPNNENFYRYTLVANKSKDTTWTYTNSRAAQFTNLTNGDYSFIINAKNNQGIWSSNPQMLNFSINPRFWDTLAFKITSLLSCLLLIYIYYLNREQTLVKKSRQEQALKNAEIKFKEAELNTLRNQMNPHFIYNSLNSIQNFIFKNDPEKANYLLSRFSTLIRKSLDHSKLNYISIIEEITFLENYLELEQMRFEDRFSYSIIKSQNVTVEDRIPPLLLQPIIENSIKHGFSKKLSKGEITISFSKEASNLKIQVTDNGKGIKTVNTDDMMDKKPHALGIIRERLNIINESNVDKASFDIEPIKVQDNIMGTRAIFIFPLTIFN